MTHRFEHVCRVRWGDLDFNQHMKNTAYLDLVADVRMMYFAQAGFPLREFERLRLGPVILRDELEYFKEMHLLETLTVTLDLMAASPDGARFRLRNAFCRADGRLAARVTSTGGWLDLDTRRLTVPPESLVRAVHALAVSADFEALEPLAGG